MPVNHNFSAHMSAENAARWYRGKKYAKSAAKFFLGRLPSTATLGLNPLSLAINGRAFKKTGDKIAMLKYIADHLRELPDNANGNNQAIQQTSRDALAFALASKQTKLGQKLMATIPMATMGATIHSAATDVSGEAAAHDDECMVHAQELWNNVVRQEDEDPLAKIIVHTLVGDSKIRFVFKTTSGVWIIAKKLNNSISIR